MNTSLFFIQCLLYMNPKIGLNYTHTTEHCFAFKSTVDLPYCNRVCHSSLITDAEVKEMKSYFGKQRFTWAANATDAESIAFLEQNNLRLVGSFPLMVIDLQELQSMHNNSEIVVKPLNQSNEDEKELWAQIVAQSFDSVNTQATKVGLFTTINLLINHIQAHLKIYWGYYHEKPVATCCAIYHDDIATIHWVGTLPEFRKHGLGSAVTQAALIEAKINGCKQAILFASPLGKPVYERFGFKEHAVYNMYGNY